MAAIEQAVRHRIEVELPVASGFDHNDALVNGRADRGPFGGFALDRAEYDYSTAVNAILLLLDQHDNARL